MTAPQPEQNAADDPTTLDRFRSEILDWTAALLDPYLDELRRLAEAGVLAPGAKEINDAIWGTIVLEPLEIIVLDSPLLQRLRQVRQLGVVHLVYPSALHSRFEHSLGAAQQVTRVVESINEHAASSDLIDNPYRKLLRLAALCHDVGHGAMSHVSERALANFESVEDMRLAFSEALKVEKPALSEIAAYYMIGSDSFRSLIEEGERRLRERDLPPDAVDLIQKAIIGQTISEKIPLLHELISGPFDADKLDYMTRDAHMTGVPVVTDIPRLVQKVRAVELPLAELPQEVQRLVDGSKASYWLTGIAISGGRTLDELLIGRTLLFDKLYRHHKVRAAEVMVASIMRAIGDLSPGGPAMLPFLLDDAAIVELDEVSAARLAGRELSEGERARASVAADLAARIKRRQLFVRAYAFAQNMPLDPYRSDRMHVQGLRKLALECGDPEQRGALVDVLVDELKGVLEVLDRRELIDAVPGADLKPYVWIDPPQAPTGTSVIAQAYLLGDSRRWLKFSEDTAEAPGWTNAYLLTRDLGYVFTTSELAPYLFLAAERVVRERYAIRTPNSMYGYAKQDEARIEELKRQLDARGHYASAPADLRPPPDRLRRGDIAGRLTALVERLAAYQGPVRPDDLREEKVVRFITRERLLDWLRQFEDDELIEAALRVVENIEMIGRPQLVHGLEEFLTNHTDFREGYLSPLGGLKDSSSILTYEALDAGAAYNMRSALLVEALNAKRPVVLVDDFVGRGSQAISILENWLGVEPSTKLGEERESSLDPALRDLLRAVPVAIFFSSGMESGAEALRIRCSELGLNATVEVANSRLPTANDERIYESGEQQRRFLEFCTQVGRELLLDPAAGHDEAWVAERALGYGNHAFLVVFPYNTPSQTLTPLWARGSMPDTRQWEPLFPRRKKR